MTSCPEILSPLTTNCSSRGVCLSQFACLCDAGFTGFGDFAFRGTAACSVNILAVSFLWGIVGVLHILELFASVRFLFKKWKILKKKTSAPILMGTGFVCSNIGLGITGLIRAIDNSRTIGSDVLVTIFFTLGVTSFWIAAHIFVFAFIELSLKQAKMSSKSVDAKEMFFKMKVQLTCSGIIATIACLLPLPMLVAKDSTTMYGLAASHYLLLAFELAFTGLIICPKYVNMVVNDIQAVLTNNVSSKNEQLKLVVKKLVQFKNELFKQALSNVVLACFMGFWPLLTTAGSSYFLPMAWFSGFVIIALAIHVHSPVGHGKTSSGDDSSSNKRNESFTALGGNSSVANLQTMGSSFQQSGPLISQSMATDLNV